MEYVDPVVAEVSPNLYAAAKTAGLSKQQATQVEQMSYTIKQHREFVKLSPDVARVKYDKLDAGAQQQLQFMFKNAEYLKEPPTTGDYVRGALLAPLKIAASPLIALFKLGGAYNQIINQPYKIARLAAQGEDPFSYKTWRKAWDGKEVYDEGALKETIDYFGKYDVEVAKGLLAGLTPGEIVEKYGNADKNILESIKKAYNQPEKFKQVLDGVKYSQVSLGRDIARMLDTKPPANGGIHGDYIDGTTKNISGVIDFIYQFAIDPLIWLTGGTSKFVTTGDRIANSILGQIDNGISAERAVEGAFSKYPKLFDLWETQLGPRIKTLSDAKTPEAKAEAYRVIKENHPAYDNPAAIKALQNGLVFDAASAKKYFENAVNLSYLMSGRVDGVTYMRNGVAVARTNRQYADGLMRYLDGVFNFRRSEKEIIKANDEIHKALINPVALLDRIGDTELEVVFQASKEIKGWKRVGQLAARSPNGLEVRLGEDAIITANNFTARARQLLPRDMAEALTQRFLVASEDEQVVILRNLDAATMYAMGLGGAPKGRDLIIKILSDKYGDKASFATKVESEVNENFAKAAPANAVQDIDGVLKSIHSGPLHPYQSTRAIGSLPYDQIGSMVWEIKSKHNLINAIGGATQGNFSKKIVDTWSILTLFPRLGIRSAIDEAIMYTLTAPLKDLRSFMSFQGYKMGNIAKTFTGSKAASGPYKRGIQAIVGQITDKNIFEILGQKITINPEEALTVLARKEAIEAYAKKNDIDSALLDSLQKREAIGEHVANLYSRYIDDKDLNYLLSAFKHSPDAINSMAQSLVAHSALSGKYSQEIIADIITPSMLDDALQELGVKMSTVQRRFLATRLSESQLALAQYEKFFKIFAGNKARITENGKEVVYLNPANIFFKNNGLRTREDVESALNAGMVAVGYKFDPITDLWYPVNKETINDFLSLSSTTVDLRAKGMSNDEIVRTRLWNMFRDMHETFNGDANSFNENLFKLVKTKFAEMQRHLDGTGKNASYNQAVASISLHDFEDATQGFRLKGEIYSAIDFEDFDAENIFRKLGNGAMDWMDQQVTGIFRQPAIMVTYTKIRSRYAGLEKEYVKQQQRGGTSLSDAIEIADKKFTEIAMRDAADTVLKFADNPSVRTNAAYQIRTVGRYYRATEDFYRRIYRMKDVAPRVLYRMRLAHLGLSASGMTHIDANGEPYVVMPMDNIIFKATNGTIGVLTGQGLQGYKQPDFNEMTLKLRMANPSFSQDAGVPTLSGPIAALSVVGLRNAFGTLPGKIPFLGDFLDEPAKIAAEQIDTMMLGNIGDNINIVKAVVPIGLQRIWAILDPTERSRQEVTAAQQAIAYNAANGLFLDPNSTEAEKSDYLRKVRITAHNVLALRNTLGLIAPVAPTVMESKGVPNYLKDVGITSLRAEFFDILNGITKTNTGEITDAYEQALATYTGKYPGKLIYTVSRDTKQTQVVVKNTEELKTWSIMNQDLVNTYGEAAYIFAPQTGKFNAATYNWIQAAGLMKNKTLEEYYNDLLVAEDKQAYYDIARKEKELLATESDLQIRSNIIREATAGREALKTSNPLLNSALIGQGNNIGTEETMLGIVQQMLFEAKLPVDKITILRMNTAVKAVRNFIVSAKTLDDSGLANKVQLKADLKDQVEATLKELSMGDLYVAEANRAIFKSILNFYSRDSYYATRITY
jgi:hypothetical protein